MSSYDTWVIESLAKEATRPAKRRVSMDTLEFARVQPADLGQFPASLTLIGHLFHPRVLLLLTAVLLLAGVL